MHISVEITVLLAILTFAMGFLVNFANAKRTARQDNEKHGYAEGKLDEKLSNIEKTLVKIERKLDTYDSEIDKRITKAIDTHIKMYHTKRGDI